MHPKYRYMIDESENVPKFRFLNKLSFFLGIILKTKIALKELNSIFENLIWPDGCYMNNIFSMEFRLLKKKSFMFK